MIVVTKSTDLRTGRSIWEQQRASPVPHKPLKRDIETDVLVIGAGITGAMMADALAGTGLRVAVVDKRGPAKGSTTASTALVQYEIDTPLIKLARKIGERDATRAWRRSRLAVDAIAAPLDELGVPDVARRDKIYLAGDPLDAEELFREHSARHAAGCASASASSAPPPSWDTAISRSTRARPRSPCCGLPSPSRSGSSLRRPSSTSTPNARA